MLIASDGPPPPAYGAAMHRLKHLLPVLAAIGGVAFLSLMDAYMKSAALAAGTYNATLLRSVFASAIVVPVWLLAGGKWPKRDVLKIHILRGSVSALMALSFFFALTKMPIAEAIAISFIAPLIALYLAAVLLGEVIRRQAVLGSILGFVGTLVIVGGQISLTTFDRDLTLGLAALAFSALLYSWNFIIIRQQSQLAKPLEIASFHSGVAGVVLLLASPWLFSVPGTESLGDITMAALLTIGGAMMLAWAYARAQAQELVPMEYSGFLWAALFGWLFFGEEVTPVTLLGTVLIVIGCLIATRKRTEQTAV